jgi:hypothetical protein
MLYLSGIARSTVFRPICGQIQAYLIDNAQDISIRFFFRLISILWFNFNKLAFSPHPNYAPPQPTPAVAVNDSEVNLQS